MWLLNTSTLALTEFDGGTPPYAILSHTWSDDEVTFKQMLKHPEDAKRRAGYSKILHCCEEARRDGLGWAWIDSSNIDKRSSAELSEAINSMWTWYQSASVCYAYLGDVPGVNVATFETRKEALNSSRWFTRGWTLQELIAPELIKFFAKDWTLIGVKRPNIQDEFMEHLSSITRIDISILRYPNKAFTASIAQRMSWASRRETKRPEDMAYCLMGIFDVHMTVIYGEGLIKAFQRLQREILSSSADQSIFAWQNPQRTSSGLLARSPADYEFSQDVVAWSPPGFPVTTLRPHTMTNLGLHINLPLIRTDQPDTMIAALRCYSLHPRRYGRVRVQLRRINRPQSSAESIQSLYRRVACSNLSFVKPVDHLGLRTDLYVLEDDHQLHVDHADWLSSASEY
jgi:heterokaryon incompatibility protein (HET)